MDTTSQLIIAAGLGLLVLFATYTVEAFKTPPHQWLAYCLRCGALTMIVYGAAFYFFDTPATPGRIYRFFVGTLMFPLVASLGVYLWHVGRLKLAGKKRAISIRKPVLLALLLFLMGQAPHQEWSYESVFTVDLMFGEIAAMSFRAPGELVVLDRSNSEYMVLDDATGEVVQRVGRKGQGPGEFGQPQLLTVTDAGKIVVFDLSGFRLTTFAPDGTYENTTTIHPRETPVGMEAAPDGLLWLRSPPTALPGTLPEDNHPALYLRAESGIKRLVWEWVEFLPMELGEVKLFRPIPIWRVLSETRVAVGSSDRYELTILDMEGNGVGHLQHDTKPTAVSEELKEQIRASVPEAYRQTVEFETYLPLIAGVFPGPGDTILVYRGSENGPMLDIFATGGDYIASVKVPENFQPMAARQGLVAGLVSGDDDEFSLSVIRIRR